MKILLVNICKEKLHYFEFVKPVWDIIKKERFECSVRFYKEIRKKDLDGCEKVIICGTSLLDNEFSNKENLKFFEWLSDFKKPVLGICGGMHVIGLIFLKKLKKVIFKKELEIGYFLEDFEKDFLGLFGKREVYHLHNYYVDFSGSRDFQVFNKGKIPQAVKHKEKNIFGVLFHPEVRNRELILNFCRKETFK